MGVKTNDSKRPGAVTSSRLRDRPESNPMRTALMRTAERLRIVLDGPLKKLVRGLPWRGEYASARPSPCIGADRMDATQQTRTGRLRASRASRV